MDARRRSKTGIVAILALLAAAGLPAPPARAAGSAPAEGQPATSARPAPSPARRARQAQYLYRTVMLRAAPGRLTDVIEALRARMPVWQRTAPAGPFWMRHSQGDQWDLLLLFPMGRGFDEYWSEAARRARRQAALEAGESDLEFELRLLPDVAWREELFVWGPPPEQVAARFDGAGLFHVEVFLALSGKRAELVHEREMENAYLEGTGRQPNLIFTRAGGAAWDCFTIGAYRDLRHFADGGELPDEVQERAAVAAGFASASAIGTYLRELIAEHHDTLAVALR